VVFQLNTGLFETIVRVLTTCHTQYTWDRSIYHMWLHLENEVAVVKTPTIISNNPVYRRIIQSTQLSVFFKFATHFNLRIHRHAKLVLYINIAVRCQWPDGVGVRPIDCWDSGFESRQWHGYLSLVSVVCCQVEVSATGWSLVQRSPTDCGASLCVI